MHYVYVDINGLTDFLMVFFPDFFCINIAFFLIGFCLSSRDLNGNKLHRLEGLVFEHLKKLKVLKLRRNEITSFSDGVFYGLNAIENL